MQTADRFFLTVNNGSNRFGTTEVRLVIREKQPCVGGLDAGSGGGTAGGTSGGAAGGVAGGASGGVAGGAAGGVAGGASGGVAGGASGGVAGGASGGIAGGASGGVAGGAAGGIAGGAAGGVAGGAAGGIAGGASGGVAGGASGGVAGGASGGIAGGASGGVAGGASGGVAGGAAGGSAGGASGGIAGGAAGGSAGGAAGGVAGGAAGGVAGGASGGIAGGAAGGSAGGASGGIAGGAAGGIAGGASGGQPTAGGASGGQPTAGGTSGGSPTAGGSPQSLSVVIDLPVPGTATSDTSVTVLGRVLSGTPPFTATVNGTPIAVVGVDFTAVLSPPEGAFTITAVAQDSSGASGQAQRTIDIDRSPPVITMLRPTTNPAQATTALVTIEGEAGDPRLAEVRVRGQVVPTVAGRFITDVTLSAGRTDVLIDAVDTLGNRATFTQRFDAPALPPTVTILAPIDGASVDDAIVRVRARVNGSVAISRVDIGTGQAFASPTGDYEADVPLALGQNTLVVRAVDVDGREGSAQVQIRYRDPATEPLKVTGIDPAAAATDVEPDRRVSIAFNKAIQPSDLTTQFVVKANGTILQGGYYVVPGNQTVSFSATQPLPEGQTITVEVQNVSPQVGPGLTAPFRSSFSVRRPLTEIHGVVLDETATPLSNVLVEIEQLGLSTRTSGQGNWSLFVPGAGRWTVKASGALRSDGRELPSTKRLVVSTDGTRVNERTIFLVATDPTATARLTNSGQPVQAGDVSLTLPSGSFAFEDGRLAGGLTMTSVPAPLRSPPLSDRIGPTQLWQSVPTGTRVLAPISAAVPNVEGAPAGRLVLFYGYVPESLTIARAGFGRVTSDGSRIETLAPFQPVSLEWFGYRVLSLDESNAVGAALNPPAPTGNGGVPDGSLGWLKWVPERFDDVVDWVLPRAHAQAILSFTREFGALDAIANSFVPARVSGRVLASSSSTRFVAMTAGVAVTQPPAGMPINPPNVAALGALTVLDGGAYRLPLDAVAQQTGVVATSQLSLAVTARRGDGSAMTEPADADWFNAGATTVAVNSFVDLAPGTTFLVFRLVEGTQSKTIEHRVDLALNPDGGPGSLALTETANTGQSSLDSLVRFAGTSVTFNGPIDTGTTTGPTGAFSIPVLSVGGPSVGIACAQVPAGVRLDVAKQVGAFTTFQYVTTSYDFCSPLVPVTPGMNANVDINVDARLFYGNLTFRDRKGRPLPLRCDESLGWNDTGDVELESISARDIATTEVSVFRADDLSEPVAVVAPGRLIDQACASDAGASAAYSMLRLGPQSLIRNNQLAFCRELDALDAGVGNAFFAANCGATRPINATLRAGDPLVVVAVNYRTGYAGLTRTRVPTINQLQGSSFESGVLPDGGVLPGTILPDGGCTTPPINVAGAFGGIEAQLPACTVQNIGIPTDLSLYPPELQIRVGRRIKTSGVNSVVREPSLVRTGGMALAGDSYLSVATRWGVRTEPEAYRRCIEQRGTACAALLLEALNDEQRDAGTLAGEADAGRPDAGALVDVGRRGLPLEVPCGDLPPGAPDASWNVCLGNVPRIVDMPKGVAPIYGQLARWTGSAIEAPVVETFPIRPGQQSNIVQVSQTIFVSGAAVTLANLSAASYYVHAVGQSQFGEVAPGVGNRTLSSPPPAPFFSEKLDGGSIPTRGIGLKTVYRSYEPGAVIVERFDATREHEFRVVELDAGAVATTSFGTRSLTTSTGDGTPRAEEGDLAYRFTAALVGPVTQSRAQQPLRDFRVRLGSDAFGQECDVRYDPAGQTIRGQCDADAVEDVLAANDIVYLELYLAGNAENVLWRTNFYGLTRRTDIVATNSLYTLKESTNVGSTNAKSRQTTIRPIASFPVRQAEIPNNTNATARLCSDATCSRVFASAVIRREDQRFKIVSVESGASLSAVGIAAPMGPDGTAIFAALLPEDYAVPESHDSVAQPAKPVFRLFQNASAGPQPPPLLLGTPRGRFESFDSSAWAQPEVGPVSVTTGRLAFDHTDLAVPYSPSVMAFTRSYNNQNNLPGALGVGWRHPFEAELYEEGPGRYVATIGMTAYQFVDCSFSLPFGAPRTAGQCFNDGTHGATLQRFSQTPTDGGDTLRAFVLTDVSGRRLLFRHQVGLDEGTREAVGARKAEFIDGGSEVLQRRWFLAGIDDGAGVMPSATDAVWFGELADNWQTITYERATSRVDRVYRQGVDGGLEWKFEYEAMADGVPSQVKAAARVWGLKPLKRVVLKSGQGDVASVSFARDAGSYSLTGATRSTDGANEQEWSYGYLSPASAGIAAFEESNEVVKAVLRLAPSDGGARQDQWKAAYERTSVASPLTNMAHVRGAEFVARFTEPGQQGVPHVLTPGPVRELRAATGETTLFQLSDYGASKETKTGPTKVFGLWSSQKDGDGLVRPALQTDSTNVATKPGFDARLRSNEQFVVPQYSAPDPDVAVIVQGNASTTDYLDDRFAHAQRVTEPVAPGSTREATRSTTTVEPNSGDVTEEKVEGTGGPFISFTANATSGYDTQHRLKQWTNDEGRVVSVTAFDTLTGLPTELTLTLPGASPQALTTLTRRMTYDTYGRMTSSVDQQTGAETRITYDALGRELTRTTKGAGLAEGSPDETVRTGYELRDNGLTVTRTYDGIGADGGYRTATTTVDGLVTRSEWTFGATNALAFETYAHDAGRVVEKRDARGAIHQFEYESGTGAFVAERVSFSGGPSITVRAVKRDDMQRVTSEVDVLGAEMRMARDLAGRNSGAEAPDAGASFVKTSTDLSGYATKTSVGTKAYEVTSNALGLPDTLKRSGPSGDEVNVKQTFDSAGRLKTRFESVSGVTESWEYKDVLGRPTRYERAFPSGSNTMRVVETRGYTDAPSRKTTVTVTRIVDNGTPETETLVVDVRGRSLSRTETISGNPATTSYEYDALGRMVKLVHPDGATRTWRYDGPGALLSETDEAGNVTTFVRDELNLNTTVTKPLGAQVVTEHDAAGRLVKRTEANLSPPSSEWTYAYPGDGWVHEFAPAPLASADARVTKRRFNGRGQVVEVRQHAGSTERVTSTTYNGSGANRVEVRDGTTWLQVIERDWDGQGRPIRARETWQSGARSYDYSNQTAWSGRSALVSHSWSEGTAPTEAWDYDGLGNAILHRVGVVEDRWSRDGLGRIKVVDSADARPAIREFFYGIDGRLIEERFGVPLERTSYVYNGRGLVSSVEMPDGRTATTTYEFELGGTKRRSLPTSQKLADTNDAADSTTTETTYDDLGRPTLIRLGAGTTDQTETQRSYGPRGELRSVTLPGGLTSTYEYDGLLRLTKVSVPGRPEETFDYADGLGRMTSHKYGARTWTYAYGAGASLETLPNPGETRTTLVDGRGRAAHVQHFPSGSTGPGITAKTMRWDGWDSLVGVDEVRSAGAPQTQAFAYDPSHRLTGVVRGLATVGYGYAVGTRRVLSRGALTYAYDGNGRLSAVNNGPWGSTLVEWEPGGQRLTKLGGETFSYDGRGWLTAVASPGRTTSYEYDKRGNRTEELVTGTSALAGTRQFVYDDADRLVATLEWDGHVEGWKLKADGTKDEAKAWPSGTAWPVTFNTPNPTKWQQYQYRPDDGTLERVVDQVSGVPDVAYVHDARGQVTSRTEGGVTTGYGWDVDGRLVTANSSGPGLPTLAAQYEYDGLGMRRRAQVSMTPITGPPVVTTRNWTWGGSNGEDEVAEDNNLTETVAGYRVGDGPNVFAHDGLGSVVSQTNASGTNDARFSSWGARSALGTNFGPLASSVGFTGHRVEDALSLSYAKRRWLDSTTGTWLSRDDVGAASYLQSPNELNPWQYAAGNPTRYTDPSGRCAFGPDSVECTEVLSAFARESLGQSVEYDSRWRRAERGLWSMSVFNEDTWKANEEARWRAGWASYITDMPAPTTGDATAWRRKREWARATEFSMQAVDTSARMYLEYVAVPYLTGEVGGVAFEGLGLLSKATTEELATTRSLVQLETITEKEVLQAQVRLAVNTSRAGTAASNYSAFRASVQNRVWLESQAQMSTVGDYYAATYGPGEYAGMGVELEAGGVSTAPLTDIALGYRFFFRANGRVSTTPIGLRTGSNVKNISARVDRLAEFAEEVGAKPYWEWGTDWVGLKTMKAVARDPDTRIHFNLDGFSRKGTDLRNAVSAGTRVTEQELQFILRTRAVRDRTTFYRAGKKIDNPRKFFGGLWGD
ncbi:MAG: DUF6531 domain-containing protein [Myxococcales bacterium]|nr:DUF6531 domain-containing protein [Myxococcales bacterium]